MSPINDNNGNGPVEKKPIDHLKGFVSTLLEPKKNEAETGTEQQEEQPPAKPFRGRDISLDKGEDRTLKFVVAAIGAVVVFVLLILGLSHKHTAKKPKADAQLAQTPQIQETQPPKPGSIVPRTAMSPAPPEDKQRRKLMPQDLENPDNEKVTSSPVPSPSKATSEPKNLAQVPPFNAGQSTNDNWTPKPYNSNSSQQEQTQSQQEKEEHAELAKPSMVFVASVGDTHTSPGNDMLLPAIGLGSGAHLIARLKSLVTSAVELPVIATIEHSYEQDGEVLIPAGAHAVGHIQQADRSGYVLIKFDRIELPHNGVIPIDAVGTNTNFGPIKGKVSGTHTGRNFLVRSFSDVGSGLALFAGNNTGGTLSESDLLRAQLAENVGSAGNQEIMQLTMTEHPIVTVDAGTDIFVVFEKMPGKSPSGNPTSSPSPQVAASQPR